MLLTPNYLADMGRIFYHGYFGDIRCSAVLKVPREIIEVYDMCARDLQPLWTLAQLEAEPIQKLIYHILSK